MSTQSISDLRDFYRFVGEKVASGANALSPEDVLDQWRDLHPSPALLDEDVAALQEAFDDMRRGDTGAPFDEFDRDFRTRRLAPKP